MAALEPWQKVLGVAAGAGAVLAAVVFCTAKAGRQREAETHGVSSEFVPTSGVSKAKLRQILQEVLESQKSTEDILLKLIADLRAAPLSFEDAYRRVQRAAPSDPLEKHGLSAIEFDALVDQYQNDQVVRDCVAKIMGMPTPASKTPEAVQQITVKQVIDIHTFMLSELEALLGAYDAKVHNSKVAVVAAQALVGARIEEKFKVTSKDLEGAVFMHHTMLATDADFTRLSVGIQAAMGKLTGSTFSTN